MIPHEKYDGIQVDNIILAAKDLIDRLSTGNTVKETKVRSYIDKQQLKRAINRLKHQLRYDYE